MQKCKVGHLFGLGFLAVLLIFTPAIAKAEVTLIDNGGFKAGLSLEMAAAVIAIQNANFDNVTYDDTDEDRGYFDGFIKPILNLSYDTAAAGSFYGGLSYAATGSYGNDGQWDMWKGNTEDIKSEQLYIGWKSGQLFSLEDDLLDLSFGEQEFQIGDGFLVYDGEFDGQYGAYWTAPHKSFDNTAVVRLNTTPVRADFFYLKSDDDYGDTELYGINVEHINDTLGTIGATWMTVTDSIDGTYGNRKGMDVYSLRGQGTPFASMGLADLFLSAEYAKEMSGDRVEKDATGWYAEAGYTVSALPWTPTLSYRYAFFSGDDAGTADDESFDPLFYGFSRGWGTHFMGEIVGEYQLFNSNQKTQMVKLNLQPTESLSVGGIYYDFKLDQKNVYGVPVTSDKFANEIDLYADYAVNDNLWLTAVFALATPDDAWKEYDGGVAEDTKLFEIGAFLYF
jgi:hypothetical protein